MIKINNGLNISKLIKKSHKFLSLFELNLEAIYKYEEFYITSYYYKFKANSEFNHY